MYGDRFQRFAPVKVGDELDVKIEAVGEKGDGIAKKDGFVLVIPNTRKDDEVRIRVTKVLRRVGFAEVVNKGASSPREREQEEIEDVEEVEDFQEEASDESYDVQSAEEYSDEEDSEDFGDDLDR